MSRSKVSPRANGTLATGARLRPVSETRRLGRVPGPWAILIKIGGSTGQAAQRVAKHVRKFTWHDAGKWNFSWRAGSKIAAFHRYRLT